MKLSTYISFFAVVCLAQRMVNGESSTSTPIPTTPTVSTTPPTPTTNTTTGPPTTPTPSTTPNTTTPTQTPTPSNTTTENSTGTPQSTNATTTIPSTTSLPPTTTPPSLVGEWKVSRPNNTMACMRMMFQGGLQMKGMASPLTIPTDASANQSMCQSADRSDFMLQFVVNGTQYVVGLYFVLQSDSKTSYMWNASVTTTNFTTGTALTSQTQVQVRFQAPMGRSFQCDQQSIIQVQDQFNITLSQMKLQPFASNSSGNYGKPFSCQPKKGGPSKAVIVGIVLGVIIFVLVIALVYERKKKKAPGGGYNNFS